MSRWIEYGKSWEQFMAEELNCPGVQVKVQSKYDPTETRQYLIGSINEQAGLSDDCMAFKNETIIIRYQTLVTQGEQSE